MSRATVLLCDDAADVRYLLKSQLRTDPRIEIIGEAKNGEEAVELVQRLRPNLVLLDVAMPLLDGLDALPEIQRVSPETKVIVVSGYSRDRMQKEALALGAKSYVPKGASQHELLTVVKAVLGVSGSGNGTPVLEARARAECIFEEAGSGWRSPRLPGAS